MIGICSRHCRCAVRREVGAFDGEAPYVLLHTDEPYLSTFGVLHAYVVLTFAEFIFVHILYFVYVVPTFAEWAGLCVWCVCDLWSSEIM